MIIRDATETDWPAIWPLFDRIVAAGETYAYPLDLTEDSGRALWMLRPPSRVVVAVEEDVILGSATMGPNRPGRGSHIATASFMVAPAARGRGVGRALGEHVVEWSGASGCRGIQFNAVVETNLSAVRLWERLGFTIMTTIPGAFDHRTLGFVGLHVMYREL